MRYIILIGFLILTCNLSEAYIPQVGTVTLFEDDNGQTTTSTSQMTPNDEMTLLVQFFDESDVIYGVNFYIWDRTTNSEKGTDTPIDHATYQWSKNDGWKLVGPLSSIWTIDKDNCKIATSTTGTGTLKLVFTPGKIARYQQNSDWKIKVVVCYTNQSQDVSGEINISNAYYSEINIDSQDAFFTSSFADTNDNPLTSPINLNIISNSNYILQIKAEDFIGENGGTISLPGPLGYALTNTSSLQNTVTPTYQTIHTYPATSEQGATQTLYLWLDYPVGQSPGTYNSQLYLATSDTQTTISLHGCILTPSEKHLVLLLAPQFAVAGSVSEVFRLERQDEFNNPITQDSLIITPYSTPDHPYEFRLTPEGGSVTTLTIPDGTSTIDFYYYDENPGTWTIKFAVIGIRSTQTTIRTVENPPLLQEINNSVFPDVVTQGEKNVSFQVAIMNLSNIGVSLSPLSTISFGDGANTFTTTLTTIIHIPGHENAILSFNPLDIPTNLVSMIYSPALSLKGTDTNSQTYSQILSGGNKVKVSPPYVTFIAENIPTEIKNPGQRPLEILKIKSENSYTATKTITAIKLTNTTQGLGSQSELDSQIERLSLYHNTTLVGTTTFTSGIAIFNSLNIPIPPDYGTTTLLVTYDLSFDFAKDQDIIDVALADVTFATTTTVNGDFPLNSYGHHLVDGMVADQIKIYDVLPDSFKSGELNDLVLNVTIPPNGYATDTLKALSIENAGTAKYEDVVFKFWLDNGDEIFGTISDICLGTMNFTGAMWHRTGLNQPIGTTGLKVFVTVDITEIADEGKTIKIKIPIKGIEVLSENDGPIDNPITNYYSQQIKVHNKVIFEALDLLKEKVYPGTKELEILNLSVTNYYSQTQTLTSLIMTNNSLGTGSLNQIDSQVDILYLYQGTANIGVANYKNSRAVFSGLNLDISPYETKYIKLRYNLSLQNARDDNIIDCHIAGSTDIGFKSATITIGGIFPLDSFGFHKIDGLVNNQIINYGAQSLTVATGTTDLVVLDVFIPGNGYADDVLTKIRIKNGGTAKDSRDIKMVKVCDGQNTYTTTWKQEYWEWTGTISVPRRIYILTDIADNPGNTIMMKIPVNGLEFLSDNDGPIDSEVINPYLQIISAGLLSSLKLTSQKVTVASTFTVKMSITANEDVYNVTPTLLVLEGSGSASLISVPQAISTLTAGSFHEFIWVYKASHIPGTLTFSGYATSTTLSSINTCSEILYIQEIPTKLVIRHIPNMPFEVNKGQQDVIPMNIVFQNTGTPTLTGDIKIGTLTFDVGTIPGRAIARMMISQTGIIYGSKTNLEISGTIAVLPLTTPVSIPPGQNVAVNLIIDIPTSSTTNRFQIGLIHIDANSNVIEAAFPLNSGWTNIKTQSPGIKVNFKNENVPKFANKGQSNVCAGQIEFKNEGENASDVKVTQLILNGTISPISNVRVKDEDIIYGEVAVAGNPVTVFFSPVITLNANIPKIVDIVVDIIENPLSTEFQIGSITIFARDSNTGEDVPVNFGSVTTSSIKLQDLAQQIIVFATSTIPTKVYQNQTDINAFELTITNPGTINSASILLKELKLFIPEVVSKIIVEGFGTYSGIQNLTLSATITPQATITINLKINIGGNLGEFRLDLLDLKFVDANDFHTITHTFGSISVLFQVKEKPVGLSVSSQTHIPVNVVKGNKDVHALTLIFNNQGGTNTDEIKIGTITLSLADRFNNPILPAAVLSRLILSYDGTQTEKTEMSGSKVMVNLVPILKVAVADSKTVEVKIDISDFATTGNFKVGVEDIEAVDNWDNPIAVLGVFPLWSEQTTIFEPAIEQSFTNYPNPFAAGKESTTIAYYLPQDGYVTIKIYTVIGDLVRILLQDNFKAHGMNEVQWDGRNGVGEVVLNGVYFCQINVHYVSGGSDKKVRKIAVVR